MERAMWRLTVDHSKCKDCGTCEVLLPKFRSVYGGVLLISKTNMEDENVRAAATYAAEQCPERAIQFKQHVSLEN